ncbi:MAG: cadherin-like domain-containing protein [Actinomycetota bacterium]
MLEDSVPGAANVRLTPGTLADVDSPTPTQVRVISVIGGTLQQSDGSVIGLGAGGSLLSLAAGSVDLRFTPTANRDTAGSFDYVVVDAANSSINSAASTATLPIVPVNDAPSAATSGGTAAFVENGSAVVVDVGVTVADIDNTDLTGATMQITGNYAPAEDVLAFTNQLGITGVWNSGSGTMTLNGTTTVANYQTALRAATYANTSENPAVSNRTVTVIVNDGAAPSVGATRQVSVTAANDAPTAAASGGNAAYTENAAAVVLDAGLTTADVDNANLASASLQITGNYSNGDVENDTLSVSGATASDGGSASVTSGGDVRVDPADSFVGTMTVAYTLSDGAATDTGSIAVTVTPVADVAVSASASPNPAVVGGEVIGDVIVRNEGPGLATSAVVIVDVGAQNRLTRASAGGQACIVSAQRARCELGNIAADASTLAEVTIRPGAAGTMQVSALAGSTALDTDDDDNVASASVTVRRSGSTSPPTTAPSSTTTTSIATVEPATSTTTSTSTSTSAPRRTTTTTEPKDHSPATVAPAQSGDEEDGGGGGSVGLALVLLTMVFAAVGAIVFGYSRVRQP